MWVVKLVVTALINSFSLPFKMFSLYLDWCLLNTTQSTFQCACCIICNLRGFVVNLMNAIDNVIVQQLLLMVVQGGVHLLVPQSSILPDLLQGVVLDQAAVLKDSHQQVLKNTEHTQINYQDDGI